MDGLATYAMANYMTTVLHTYLDWDLIEQWAAAWPIKTCFIITKPLEHNPLGLGSFQYVMDYGEVTDWEMEKPDYKA